MNNRSKVVRAQGYRWEGVPLREYKAQAVHFEGITRQTLLGEGEGEMALPHLTRYFEIQPGGYSSLERHEHIHTVVIIRGQGEVILEDRVEPVALHDVVYVAPRAFHQFHATGEEPLGFLCIVCRDRDRPELPDSTQLERLRARPRVGRRIKP